MVLEIIESILEDPIRFPVDPNAQFVPGQVAQIDYDKMICGVSNGQRPFGLIDDIRTKAVDSTDSIGLIHVWPQRMVFRTDQYQSTEEDDAIVHYETGDLLYVNSKGFLTALRYYDDSIPVARVITVFDARSPYVQDIIECVWF